MTESAPRKGTKALRAVIELLVGIPSVVYGYIGLMVVVPLVRKLIGGTGFGILAGTLVLFVMILPTVISLTADSLKAIPVSYRQAALALGATKWQAIYKIVLRAALPGILTAIIFGMTRGSPCGANGNWKRRFNAGRTWNSDRNADQSVDQSNGKYGFRNGLKQCIMVTGIGSIIDVTGLQPVDQGNYPERSN